MSTNYVTTFLGTPTLVSTNRPKRSRVQCSVSRKANVETAAPPKRQISEEAKSKISKALKGRVISETHRSRISASLSGSNNPRYGRKVSEETRKRIGAAVAAAASARKKAKERKDDTPKQSAKLNQSASDDEVPLWERKLRAKAANSPLLTGRKVDRKEETKIDELLKRVREGTIPPDSVRRARSIMAPAKQVALVNKKCAGCRGVGNTECADCVGRFGTVSFRCESCFGAGYSFCKFCQGTGIAQ